MLLAGYDKGEDGGPSLYTCDYLGTLTKLKFAAEGYGSYFIWSTLDRNWKKNMDIDAALVVLRKCIAEVQKRLLISQPHFAVKVVDKNGIRIIDAADVNDPFKKGQLAEAAAASAAPAQSVQATA